MSEPPTAPSGPHESAADMDVTDELRAEATAAAASARTADATGSDATAPSDAELITATRAGDAEAFGMLYARHVAAAQRLARSMVSDPAAVDDLVAESFAKVLAALRAGLGPDLALRAYLLTTLRHTCDDRVRRDKQVELTSDMSTHDSGEAFEDPAVARMERRYAARAFAKLPERWRLVLWHTEVEDESPAQIAPLLGLTPNGVSALAYRARERLRQLYLKEHIDETAESCHWAAERLGAHVRDTLAPRDVAKVQAHLDECERCRVLYVELAEVNANLRGVLAWVVLGTAAPGYLGVATGNGAAAVAAGAGLLGWWSGAVGGVRRGVRRIGPRNAAIGGAAVAAAAAAILAASMVSPPPRPPSSQQNAAPAAPAQPAVPPQQPPAPAETPAPDQPGAPPPVDDPVPPGARPPVGAPTSPTPPGQVPSPLPPFLITPQTGDGIVAGSVTELPVTIRATGVSSPGTGALAMGGRRGQAIAFDVVPRQPEGHHRLRMRVTFPSGIRLSGVAARDGWVCVPTFHGAACSRPKLKDGEVTTARLPIVVDPRLSGEHPVTVTVTDGTLEATHTFPVTITPAMVMAYEEEKGYAKHHREKDQANRHREKGHVKDRKHGKPKARRGGGLYRFFALVVAPWMAW